MAWLTVNERRRGFILLGHVHVTTPGIQSSQSVLAIAQWFHRSGVRPAGCRVSNREGRADAVVSDFP